MEKPLSQNERIGDNPSTPIIWIHRQIYVSSMEASRYSSQGPSSGSAGIDRFLPGGSVTLETQLETSDAFVNFDFHGLKALRWPLSCD